MYEQGPIRPPSEATSLLVRVTRNCPWNQCIFCPAYKGTKFSRRTVEEVKRDIDEMAEEYEQFSRAVLTVFLQDADSLIIKTEDLIEILSHIKKRFPTVRRITSYARATTLRKKSLEELRMLRAAGLNRIHVGMESGSEEVLRLVKKGITKEDIIEGGLKAKDAGMELSEYIMPGLGGKLLSETHAKETAEVLNIIEPHFIRVRTFAIHPLSPLARMAKEGTFIPLNDEEIVREIKLLLENLKEMRSYFSSGDFSLNLLMELDGYLGEKKREMLDLIDRYLSLDDTKKKVYSLIRRAFLFNYPLDVLENEELVSKLSKEIERIESSWSEGFDEYIRYLMSHQLPQPQKASWN
ncbi:MAG: radical SAM protein [Desulfobacterota bacterium]|nr:radical SAM protein [Thermodesulfobacteriota bacterium]MDW8001160.1 radical SAM protein [Deltaproteobacteria bacterium]